MTVSICSAGDAKKGSETKWKKKEKPKSRRTKDQLISSLPKRSNTKKNELCTESIVAVTWFSWMSQSIDVAAPDGGKDSV